MNLTPPSSISRMSRSKFIVIIIGLLVVGGAVYGGIWWWGNSQLGEEIVPTFTPQVSATIDLARFLKDNYGIEWNFPEDMEVKLDDYGDQSGTLAAISIISKDNIFDGLVNIVHTSSLYQDEVCPGNHDVDRLLFSVKEVYALSGGKKVKICEANRRDHQNIPITYYSNFITLDNGMTVDFRSLMLSKDKDVVLQKYKQILSTFKFTK